MREADKRRLAWIGDAVLALYARLWILEQPWIPESERAPAFKRMTSNHFLASVGEPTRVEAAIGSRYQEEGLDAAFAHIENELVPLFLRQETNRRKHGAQPRRSQS